MVAVQQPPFVDSVNVCSPMRNLNMLSIRGGIWHEIALKTARDGSDEHKLARRPGSLMLFKIDTSVTYTIFPFLQKNILPGKVVFGIDAIAVKIVKSVGCKMLWEEGKNVRICSNTFGEKLLMYVIIKLAIQN